MSDIRIIDLRERMAQNQRDHDALAEYVADIKAGRYPDPICTYEAENGHLPGAEHGLDMQMKAR